MNKEIERKYAVKYLPEEIEIEKIQKIEQAFIYKDENTIIRIRKIETKQSTEHIYTVKTKGDISYDDTNPLGQKYEIESNITKELYEKLLLKKISNKITKTRIVVPIQNSLKVEIDIYYDYLQGFLTAEVEFPNEKDANQFNKPDWLGEEIGYKELSNRKLAEMTQEQFRSKVSEEFMRNNQKIIEKLKELTKEK
ncbi:MAG: hypothetical protein HFJ35_00310 [Clostridia bacterium]|nr:hypothetical protein [Clostridia bacterium]